MLLNLFIAQSKYNIRGESRGQKTYIGESKGSIHVKTRLLILLLEGERLKVIGNAEIWSVSWFRSPGEKED